MNVQSYLLMSLMSVCGAPLMGQTTIESPVTRMVFQRSATNSAIVPVRGKTPGTATRIQGRLVSRQGGQTTDWREGSISNGNYQINIPATGGFYDLELVTLAGSSELGRQRLERVGVGEVFVVSGQSNNFGQPGQGTPATDDRVSVLNYWPGEDGHVDESALPAAFSQAGAGTFCGPRNPLFIWGALGDRLTARLGVPVLFLGAAHPGASSQNWREAAEGVEQVSGRDWSGNIPYRPLKITLQRYGQRTGLRGILWHQGESDNSYQTMEGYVNNVRVVIRKTREDSGFSNLSWMIARASYFPFYSGHEQDQAIITAQNMLISGNSNCFPGPYTDPYIGAGFRSDLLHFSGGAYTFLADLWSNSLSADYFRQSQPSLPNYGPVSPVASGSDSKGDNTATTSPPASAPGTTGGPLTILTPNYDCQTGAIQINLSGGNGSAIEVAIPGVMNWTTSLSQQVGEGIRRDAQTLLILARQAGQQVSLTWNIRAACNGSAPAPTPPTTVNTPAQPNTNTPVGKALTLTAPLYNCQTGALTFQTSGGNGTPIEFMAPGITIWTTNPSHTLGAGVRRDSQTLTLFARQSGQQVTLVWTIQAACDGSTPPATQPPVTSTPPSTSTPSTGSPVVNAPAQPGTPSAAGSLVVLAPIYNCQTGAITFSAIGGGTGPIEYMAPGITGWSATQTHLVDVGVRRDATTLLIMARRSGQEASLVWNVREACSATSTTKTARIAQPGEVSEFRWSVGPNPTTETVQLQWPNNQPLTWSSRVLSVSGYDLPVPPPVTTPAGLKLDLRQAPSGIYLWQVTLEGYPPQTFKVMKLQ